MIPKIFASVQTIFLEKWPWKKTITPPPKKYFQQVVDRCEKFRKSVQDSPLKICFNDTQKKPFQYLQHVLFKEKDDAAALLVGEMGRGRDFYDKVKISETSRSTSSLVKQSLMTKTLREGNSHYFDLRVFKNILPSVPPTQ